MSSNMMSVSKGKDQFAILDSETDFGNEIQANFPPWDLAEGTNVVCPDHLKDSLYLISSGVLRMYTKSKGLETTRWFFAKGDIAFSPICFFCGQPSDVYITAASHCIVTRIEKSYYFELCKRYPQFECVVNNLQANFLRKAAQYSDDVKMLNATQRYSKFILEYPHVNNLIQVKHLSSFLGMTPETLSRVRKEFRKQSFSE
jgi:CRP-like cAMP-binding protein